MSIFHVFFLSLIQGATEFLPVSSSAHLVLYNKFVVGLQNNLDLDIAVHVGRLMAVVLLLVKPLRENTSNFLENNGVKRSLFLLVLATLPLISMGIFWSMHALLIYQDK